MPQLGTTDPVFYRHWIIANGWAEAAGLGTTFVLGRALVPWLEHATGTVAVLLGALAAVLLGTLLEGVLVGVAQEAVLRERIASLRKRAWMLATAAGAALAWTLGIIPSTVIAFRPEATFQSPVTEPGALAQFALAVALGLVAGPVLGFAQWTVLRHHVAHAARWLWANAAAWAVGMPLVFLGMEFVPWHGPSAVAFLAIYGVCGVVGLVVGAIHGRFLLGLTRFIDTPAPESCSR
jgi:hypothetical protein